MEATLRGISNSACGSDYIYDKSLIRWGGTRTWVSSDIWIVAWVALGFSAQWVVAIWNTASLAWVREKQKLHLQMRVLASGYTNAFKPKCKSTTSGRLCCVQWARERMPARATVVDLLLPGIASGLNSFRSLGSRNKTDDFCISWKLGFLGFPASHIHLRVISLMHFCDRLALFLGVMVVLVLMPLEFMPGSPSEEYDRAQISQLSGGRKF